MIEMLSAINLKQKPYISMEMDYPHMFSAPPIKDTVCSESLYIAIENNDIDKVYAMRVLPLHDLIALKIKYKLKDRPESVIISCPGFVLLKTIWDCNNVEFNKGILHYLQHSKHALYQFSNKKNFPLNTDEINSWYYSLILGKDV